MSHEFLFDMEAFFLALADKTRLRLLNLMGENEVCVGFLVEVLGESQPKISRHLAYLRSAGIVTARRDGKWIYYTVSPPENSFAAQVLKDTLDWLASQKEMRADHRKLLEICSLANPFAPVSFDTSQNILRKAHTIGEGKKEIETFLL